MPWIASNELLRADPTFPDFFTCRPRVQLPTRRVTSGSGIESALSFTYLCFKIHFFLLILERTLGLRWA